MKLGIAEKLGAYVGILSLAIGLISGALYFYNSGENLVKKEIKIFADLLREEAHHMKSTFDEVKSDVQFLASTPPIEGIIRTSQLRLQDQSNGSTKQQWRNRLAIIFSGMLKAKSDYLQIRFIGVEDDGREIVRVDRDGSVIRVISDEHLQSKAQERYFKEAVKRPYGSVYLSDISLNREHGAVVEPHVPVMRFSMVVKDEDGSIFGIIIINMDVTYLFKHDENNQIEVFQRYFVTNSEGDYIGHPDPARRFGFDLGWVYRIQHDYPSLAGYMIDKANSSKDYFDLAIGQEILFFHKVFFDDMDPSRFIGLSAMEEKNKIIASALEMRNAGYIWIFLASLTLSLLTYHLIRLRIQDIVSITQANEKFASGNRDVQVSLNRRDEIGELSKAFNEMVVRYNSNELALKNSEERFKLAIQGSSEGIWDWNMQTSELFYSKRFKDLLGVNDEEFPNVFASFEEVLHPDDMDRTLRAIDDHLANHIPYDIEYRLRVKNGEYRWFNARGQAIWDESGNPVRMAGSILDITSRQQASERLEESEARIHAIVDTVVDCIITIDSEGKIVNVNPAVEKMFGYYSSELIGESVETLMPEVEAIHHHNYIQNYVSTGAASVINKGREIYGKRKDRTLFPIELTVSEVEYGDQQLFTGILRDITERKQAEQKLLDFRDHLQEMVDEKTYDLTHARDAALAAERAMSAFLANMSHELRTPLHGILSYSNFGLKKVGAISDDKLKQYFSEISESGNNLLLLVNDLLDLSKLRAGKMAYEFSCLNPNMVISSVVSELHSIAMDKGINILVSDNSGEQTCQLDRLKFSQVVRNLLSNAIKFSPVGSEIEVINQYRDDDSLYEISVCDHGIGIPVGEEEEIFKAFQQSTKTRTSAGGTGLGLAICKEIIEAGHGGEIKACQRDGGGTCFIIRLPADN